MVRKTELEKGGGLGRCPQAAGSSELGEGSVSERSIGYKYILAEGLGTSTHVQHAPLKTELSRV